MFDVHAHLNLPEFAADLDLVLVRARDAGLRAILCVGLDGASSARAVELARSHPGFVFAAVGIHPSHWGESSADEMERIADLARLPEVVAIGETGLDFHHEFTQPDAQMDGFARHLALARRVGKPLIVHSRKADAQVLDLLAGEGRALRGVRHCFDRDADVAERYLELGLHLSVGGAVTRDGDKRLKAAVAALPSDRLLLETDCPYQTPAPRAPGRNEPAFLADVAAAVARLRGEPVEQVACTSEANARALFGV